MASSSRQAESTRGISWGTAVAGWLLCSLATIALYAVLVRPDLRLWNGIDTHGSTTRRAIALTFDDGPHPLWTPLLADTLEQHHARGTFFLVGNNATIYPEITAQLARGGHQIGNHSLTHPYPNLTAFSDQRVKNEIEAGRQVLCDLTGQPVRDFRPPGGGVNDAIIAVLQADHLRMGWWSVNIGDWSSPQPEVIDARLRQALRPGLVVLMHQRKPTITALARFLAEPDGEHYTYTTLTDVTQQ